MNKCQDLYKFISQNTPWEIAAKILLYSREIGVEKVTEIVGGKEEHHGIIFEAFLQRQDFSDQNLEKCFRKTMQTFRLSGVESQVIIRIMERFGKKWFENDANQLFVDGEECYEMAYLIIVLQTILHNPSIKKKLQAKDFEIQA